MKILVFGISGLIGNSLFRMLSMNPDHDVYGTCRDEAIRKYFSNDLQERIIPNIDIGNHAYLLNLIERYLPDIVINCIGITKHSSDYDHIAKVIRVNSLWPHELAKFCSVVGAKLIQVSTDCVFSGQCGNYSELDFPDSDDLYGRSKVLGEVTYNKHLTLRISTIGHEIRTSYGLLDWFLSQGNSCKGYSRAFFSGFPSVYFAQILSEFVLPRPELKGLYHISADPIDKFSLLKLIALQYGKKIHIQADEAVVINRSLNGSKFSNETGFLCLKWPELIKLMAETNGINKNV